MADQKKDKPKVNVRDLKPNKDAKGGRNRQTSATTTTTTKSPTSFRSL